MSQEEKAGNGTPFPPAGSVRVLLIAAIDHERRNPYRDVLEQARYDVVVVSHDEARASVRSACPALIILQLADRGVPDLSLVRELRTHADTRGMPLITLTRFDDAYTREQIVRAGGSAILIDPVKAPLLLRQLRRLLARTPGAAAVSPGTEKLTVMPAP
jgi:DNA-binding response OmpR family regulator